MSAEDKNATKRAAAIWRTSFLVWGALLALVLLTLWLAYLPLGRFNLSVSLLIAAVKTALIGAIFMELRFAKNLIRLAAGAAFVWIAIMFALTFSDVASRVQ